MNENEKYIAYTRALNTLFVCQSDVAQIKLENK